MRFEPQFLDDIRARLPVSQVVGRKVALKKAGREWRGLSPFKTEKTPSFFVNDQKAFYHCFASGEHGDIFTFVMKTEGLSFPESVERLANEAGLAVPKMQAHDPEIEDRRQRLYALLETSAKFFGASLHSRIGRDARGYLDKRGLKRDTLASFRIGFAPNSRNALKDHLSQAGFRVDEMIMSGMLIGGEDIAKPYDRFRNRVIFPIMDLKGRAIAFGGRALDPNQPAKYLNSPETPLFHKGRVLFNFHTARQPAYEAGRIIAVEGYMDVVALGEVGIMETVAPLGTALTEQQLSLLWRNTDEPILCFDGDNAGRKAAWRAIDTALPHLTPGKSLSFAFLPDGVDPDDLVRAQGRDALEVILARARPMIDVVFEREWTKGDVATPERRARLEQQLNTVAASITHASIRNHYQREVRSRLWERLRQSGSQASSQRVGSYKQRHSRTKASSMPQRHRGSDYGPTQSGYGSGAMASESLLNSSLVAGNSAAIPHREALLLASLINHPWLIEDYAETIAVLEFTSPALSRLRDGVLSAQAAEKVLDRPAIHSQLSKLGLDQVVGQIGKAITHRCDKFADPETGHAEVEAGWRHTLELHERQVGLRKSLEAAERAWHAEASEEAFVRIRDLQQQIDRFAATPSNSEGPTKGIAEDEGPEDSQITATIGSRQLEATDQKNRV